MGFVWVEYDSDRQKRTFLFFFLWTNYISKGLIRKIETTLGMSNKGGLK